MTDPQFKGVITTYTHEEFWTGVYIVQVVCWKAVMLYVDRVAHTSAIGTVWLVVNSFALLIAHNKS